MRSLLPLICWAVFVLFPAISGGQPPPAQPEAANPALRAAVLSADAVIRILDETVDWYRTLGTQEQNAHEPSDLLILFANRQTADEVVKLAFDIARANAELLSNAAETEARAAGNASSPQALVQMQSQLEAQRQTIQAQIDALRATPGGTPGARRDSAARLAELQSELALADARKNLLDTMADFVAENDPKSADANALKAHIDAIAATVPPSGANAGSAATGAATAVGAAASAAGAAKDAAQTTARYGIWDLMQNALRLRGKIATIDGIDRRTAALAATFAALAAAPREQLQSLSRRSDALAQQAAADGGAASRPLRGQFDTLAWLFKQTSGVLLPLAKEQILLRQYRHNLGSWHEAANRQYRDAIAALGLRLCILAGILAVVFLLSEVWRRAVLRYVQEVRRRHQLLLVRRIVTWTAVVLIVGISFATEISTFATFAGLLSAGLAVAMQNVLVSVVGYFFLIGKHGIRVGDRIQIGTVAGEVIDIGLVRMHLMELNTEGPLGPTGRVVAFPNLVVFQSSGGLFKRIPGVDIAWHETNLVLPDADDYVALKAKLLAAVSEVTDQYRDELLRQTRQIEKSTATISEDDATPKVQMQLADGRMAASIGYPVHLKHAAEIDERVSEALLRVLKETRRAAPPRASEACG